MKNNNFIWDGRIAVSRRNSRMINFRAEKELAEKLEKYENISGFVRDAVEKEIEEEEKLQRWVKEMELEWLLYSGGYRKVYKRLNLIIFKEIWG